jgi:hypothetical protein
MRAQGIRIAAALALFTVGAAACSSRGSAIPSQSTFAQTTTPVAVGSALPPYNPHIEPASFVASVNNPYFPLTPGMTYVYEGNRDGVPRRAEVTVTNETKQILGVTCVVVRDVVTSNTQLVEKTTDWYAQDASGNVWYFGEDTKEYTNGAVSSTAGTWMAGVDGALPGIIMEAHPKANDSYRQEYRPTVAEDFAKVLRVDDSGRWPTGTYNHIVVTQDTDLLDASKLELKSYAPGIGYLGSEGIVNGHHEVVKVTQILRAH